MADDARGLAVGLPDLAWLAKDLEETDAVHSMFASILDYAFTSGTRLSPGTRLTSPSAR